MLFDENWFFNKNQFDDFLWKLSEWFLCDRVSYDNGFISFFYEYKAPFITAISYETYFC